MDLWLMLWRCTKNTNFTVVCCSLMILSESLPLEQGLSNYPSATSKGSLRHSRGSMTDRGPKAVGGGNESSLSLRDYVN